MDRSLARNEKARVSVPLCVVVPSCPSCMCVGGFTWLGQDPERVSFPWTDAGETNSGGSNSGQLLRRIPYSVPRTRTREAEQGKSPERALVCWLTIT